MAKGGFRGMPGGMGNMGNLMAQAQKMQREMELAQGEIATMRIEGTAGGDKVKLTLGGDHKIYGLVIDPEVVDPDDSEMLSDLIIAAYNNANEQLEETSSARLSKATGGMKLPF